MEVFFLSHGGIPKSSKSWMTILAFETHGDFGISHFKKPPKNTVDSWKYDKPPHVT